MNEDNMQLVVISDRNPEGEGLCRKCGWTCTIDPKVYRAIVLGASILCQECAARLKSEHPDGMIRAHEIEQAIEGT